MSGRADMRGSEAETLLGNGRPCAVRRRDAACEPRLDAVRARDGVHRADLGR
jgi:hypothetical protein